MTDVFSTEAIGSTSEVTLIDVLTQLAYRKRLIFGITGTATLLGIAVSLILPVRYTATTKIMPPQQTQSAASMMMNQLASSGSGSLALLAGGGWGLKNPNDIYVSLLTSRPIADTIIQKFNLSASYRSRDMTAARKKLASYTDVNAEKGGLIAVSVTDREKKRVASMANAYVEELRTLTRTLAVTEASQRRLFYEEQLKEARESLLQAESAFQQVQQSKGLVVLDAQAKAMIESLADLRAKAAAKQVQIQALRSFATDRNPQFETAELELAAIKSEIANLEQRNRTSNAQELGLGDVPGAGMDYLRAEHEVRYRQALFDLLIKQYDAARLDEGKEALIIQVAESAIEPDRKSSPQRTLIVLLSAASGFFIGCVVALILWWNQCAQSDRKLADQLRELKFALFK